MSYKPFLSDQDYLESNILGCAMIEQGVAPLVCHNAKPEYFRYEFNQRVFSCIMDNVAAFKPTDFISIVETYKNKYKTDSYGIDNVYYKITLMTRDVCSSAAIQNWLNILFERYSDREMSELTERTSNMNAFEKKEFLEKLINKTSISRTNTTWVSMGKVVTDYIDFYNSKKLNPVSPYTTGIQELDNILHGFNAEELVIIASRPSVGKSAFMQQIVLNMAKANLTVGVVSLEMSNNQIMSRMVSHFGQVHHEAIKRTSLSYDEEQRMHEVLLSMKSLNILMSDKTSCTIEGIIASCFKLIATKKLDVLIIDYLQLMSAEERTNTKNDEVGKITRGLKNLAAQLKIPVIALAQLNRDVKGNERPQLHNLRDSGNVEQDANTVIFLHGDIELPDREIIVAKQRDGKLGVVKCVYNGDYMRFEAVSSTQQANHSFIV